MFFVGHLNQKRKELASIYGQEMLTTPCCFRNAILNGAAIATSKGCVICDECAGNIMNLNLMAMNSCTKIMLGFIDDEVPTAIVDDDPMDYMFTSKQRDIEEKLEGLKVLYISGLKSEAAEVVIKYIQDIISLTTMREQICFIVDLLRPNGNDSPLASFSQIGTCFVYLKEQQVLIIDVSWKFGKLGETVLYQMSKLMK